MAGIRLVKELGWSDFQCAANLLDGAKGRIFRRGLKSGEGADGNTQPFGQGTMCLFALNFAKLPLNCSCGIHFQLADLAEMMFHIWNKYRWGAERQKETRNGEARQKEDIA